jgi:hypothetical protein
MINRTCIVLLLQLMFLSAIVAQQQHFIFIQSENRQPFNVMLSKSNYSSSANGYLVIPKLASGTYSFTIGFAGNEIQDQPFHCVVDKKDLGFTLKKFGDKGWGLFNLQTFEIVMANQKPVIVPKPNNPTNNANIPPVSTKDDQKSVVKNNETLAQPKDSVAIVAPKNTLPKDTVTAVVDPVITKPVVVEPTPQKPAITQPVATQTQNNSKQMGVIKTGESGFNTGVQLTFIETESNYIDTIRAFIPYQAQPQQPATVSSPAVNVADTTAKSFNTNCINLAADDDFFKLRRKMSAESEDEPMIAAAKKVFKAKCFTVQQIKNLSTLFLNDNGRYDFFVAAYPFSYDVHKFATLITELTDTALINKFAELTKSK